MPRRPGGRTVTTVVLICLGALLTLVFVGVGVAVVALLAGARSPQVWRQFADVGQAFGVLESLMSGLAFVALIVTLWVQRSELRLQQAELRQQRDAIERSNAELRRSAEADMRMLHFELIKMSVEDARLADVWPHPAAAGDAAQRRQFIYANLIYQHQALSMRVGGADDAVVYRRLRHLFGSPVIRAYWRATAEERAAMLAPGSEDLRIATIGDRVCAELDEGSDGR
jgi:hypothetical protein